MTTTLLLFGTLLSPASACESHDFLVDSRLAYEHHVQVLRQTAKTAPKAPPAPAKLAQPTEKSKPAKPAPPPHLFM
jgi:hypothetical protein